MLTMSKVDKQLRDGKTLEKSLLVKVISSERLFRILSAMRGPDDEDEDAKLVFTARIRYLALQSKPPTDYFGWTLRYEAKVNKDTLLSLATKEITYHFRSHAISALNALKELGLVKKAEVEFLKELGMQLGLTKESRAKSIVLFLKSYPQFVE